MKIEISDKELTAIKAAAHCLLYSREAKRGGIYVENIHDENSRQISFNEAIEVIYNLLDSVEMVIDHGC